MKNESLMMRFVGPLSIIMGLYGFTWGAVQLYSSDWIHMITWFQFVPVGFQLPATINLHNLNATLEIVFYLMMITGGIKFLKKKIDASGLLRFCYCVIFLTSTLRFLTSSIRPFIPMKGEFSALKGEWGMNLVWILYPLLYAVFAYVVIQKTEKRLILLTPVTPDMPTENFFKQKSDQGQRFAHFIFDYILAASLLGPVVYLINLINGHFRPQIYTGFFLIGLITLNRLFYFTISETLFRSSPVKFLTGSRIVNDYGSGIPSFVDVLIRTLSRFIPFEPFSFLGKNGWHDTISKTRVINEPYAKQGNALVGIWIILLIILPIGKYGSTFYTEVHEKRNYRHFEAETEAARRKSLVENLGPDYVVIYSTVNGSYRNPEYAFKIDHASADSLWGYTIKLLDREGNSPLKLVELMQVKKVDSLERIFRRSLEQSFLSDNPEYLFPNRSPYQVKEIFNLRPPLIKESKSSSYRKLKSGYMSFSCSLIFELDMATLISIEPIKGEINWTTPLPQIPQWFETEKMGIIRLDAEIAKEGKRHASLLIFQTKEGEKIKYMAEGLGHRIEIYRIFSE